MVLDLHRRQRQSQREGGRAAAAQPAATAEVVTTAPPAAPVASLLLERARIDALQLQHGSERHRCAAGPQAGSDESSGGGDDLRGRRCSTSGGDSFALRSDRPSSDCFRESDRTSQQQQCPFKLLAAGCSLQRPTTGGERERERERGSLLLPLS